MRTLSIIPENGPSTSDARSVKVCQPGTESHRVPQPAPNRFSTQEPYEENDEPQPQERFEFGLMKLNPCRISVSS